MKHLMLALMLFTLAVSAQPPYQEVQEKNFFRSKYLQKSPLLFRPYPVYRGDGRYCVYFPVELQYRFLQFVREGDRYAAKAEIDLNVNREGAAPGETIPPAAANKIWQTACQVNDFDATLSRSRYHFTVDTLSLPPGNYRVVLKYRDLNGEQRLLLQQKLVLPEVKDFQAFLPLFSRPDSLAENPFPDAPAVPSPMTGYWDFDRDLGIFLQSWRENPALPARVRLDLMNDANDEIIYTAAVDFDSRRALARSQVIIPRERLAEGQYRLKTVYTFGKDSTRFVIPFKVVWFDKPRSLWDPELALGPLRYLMDEADYKALAEVDRESRMQRLKAFWQEKDPTPETPYNELQAEFYSRVDSTLSLFSVGNMLGWKTPLGQVYILNGPPGEIEDRSLDPIPNPYLRWIYYQNGKRVVYTFRAVDGRREYRLTGMEEETL